MLNDWYWEKIDDSEYKLKDTSGNTTACLIRDVRGKWRCRLYTKDLVTEITGDFEEQKSDEEIVWQATLLINKTCNRFANIFHYISDHLPSLYVMNLKSNQR